MTTSRTTNPNPTEEGDLNASSQITADELADTLKETKLKEEADAAAANAAKAHVEVEDEPEADADADERKENEQTLKATETQVNPVLTTEVTNASTNPAALFSGTDGRKSPNLGGRNSPVPPLAVVTNNTDAAPTNESNSPRHSPR